MMVIKPTMRESILAVVNTRQGVRSVELAMNVMSEINPVKFNTEEFHLELENLVKNGEIFELNYTLPGMEYRTKSIYFPRGTKIQS